MTHGTPEIDPHVSDIARFYDHHRTAAHIEARSAEGFNKTYGIVHPMEQWASNRDVRLSPINARQRELGAVFFEAAGWERPFWYGANERLLGEYGDRVMPREAEWDSRWWSPIINAEHLAMRDRVGMVDLSAFAIFDVSGPGAIGLPPGPRRHPGRRAGRTGRVHAAPERGRRDRGGPHDHAARPRPVPGRDRRRHGHARQEVVRRPPARPTDRRSSTTRRPRWYTLGVWGPRARDLLAAATADDVSNEGFPFGTCRAIDIGGVRALASRISYVGELGWEIYAPMEQGLRLWDTLWEAGAPHGVVAVGIGVYATTGRLEKGYRAHGNELELDFDLVEAGMARPKVKSPDFVGKAAYLEQRAKPPAAILCTLTVDDPTSSSGVARYMLGKRADH